MDEVTVETKDIFSQYQIAGFCFLNNENRIKNLVLNIEVRPLLNRDEGGVDGEGSKWERGGA